MHFDGYTYVILRVLLSNLSFICILPIILLCYWPYNVNKWIKNAYEWKSEKLGWLPTYSVITNGLITKMYW